MNLVHILHSAMLGAIFGMTVLIYKTMTKKR